MSIKGTAQLSLDAKEDFQIPLMIDGDREFATLMIDGVRYHFERLEKDALMAGYQVDKDPDYEPQCDSDGFCYILAPFSKTPDL